VADVYALLSTEIAAYNQVAADMHAALAAAYAHNTNWLQYNVPAAQLAGRNQAVPVNAARDAWLNANFDMANMDWLDYGGYNANPNQDTSGTWAPNTRRVYRQILTGPFYAVEIIPTIMGTFGGVMTEFRHSRVLYQGQEDVFIPGLYAVGENSNRAFYWHSYISGSASLQAVMTGRAAGAHAALFVRGLAQ